MTSEELGLALPDGTSVINKGISFMKKDYEDLVSTSMSLLKQAKKNRWENADVAALYGIFYASIGGLIRSGSLVRRDTGIDGFPEIHVIAGEKEFRCRESVLYGILKEETDELISPYEDTFSSYVDNHPFHIINTETIQSQTVLPDSEPTSSVSGKKRLSKKESESLAKAKENFEKQIQQLNAAHAKELLESKNAYKKAQDHIQILEMQVKNKKSTANLDAAQQELEKTNSLIKELTDDLNKSRIECTTKDADIKRLTDQLVSIQETAGKNYKDDYLEIKKKYEKLQEESALADGSFYDSILPELIQSINNSKSDLIIKAVLILISLSGIAGCFLFLV